MLWIVDLISIKKNIILYKNITDAFFEVILKWAKERNRIIRQLEKKGNIDKANRFL